MLILFSKIDKKYIKPSKIECSKLVPYSKWIYESKKIGLGGVPFFSFYLKN